MGFEAFLSFLGLTRRRESPPPPAICRLAGCQRRCYQDRGRIHEFCRKSHADAHAALQAAANQPSAGYRTRQGSGRRSAPLPRFDATREYVSRNLVLFWQPPSVFSQWTPSRFVVEEVRPRAGPLQATDLQYRRCSVKSGGTVGRVAGRPYSREQSAVNCVWERYLSRTSTLLALSIIGRLHLHFVPRTPSVDNTDSSQPPSRKADRRKTPGYQNNRGPWVVVYRRQRHHG